MRRNFKKVNSEIDFFWTETRLWNYVSIYNEDYPTIFRVSFHRKGTLNFLNIRGIQFNSRLRLFFSHVEGNSGVNVEDKRCCNWTSCVSSSEFFCIGWTKCCKVGWTIREKCQFLCTYSQYRIVCTFHLDVLLANKVPTWSKSWNAEAHFLYLHNLLGKLFEFLVTKILQSPH